MWQWVDLAVFTPVTVDSAETCKGVLAVDVHSARAADTLAAGASECQCWVDLVLDFDERIQNLEEKAGIKLNNVRFADLLNVGTHHGSALVEVDLVRLQSRLLRRLIRILVQYSINVHWL